MRREQSHSNVCVLRVICWIGKKKKEQSKLKRDLFLEFSFFSENKDKKEKSLLYTHITMFPHFNFLQMCKAHLDIVKYFFFFFFLSDLFFFFLKGTWFSLTCSCYVPLTCICVSYTHDCLPGVKYVLKLIQVILWLCTISFLYTVSFFFFFLSHFFYLNIFHGCKQLLDLFSWPLWRRLNGKLY